MKHSTATNILRRLIEDGHPVNELYEAQNNAHTAPLANMILNSSVIEARAGEPWVYKSLAYWGEEAYVQSGHIYIDATKKSDWIKKAITDFSYNVCVNILYEEEGLTLFVKDGDAFRPARKGDQNYDFICRLRDDSALFDLRFSAAPTWANELFIQFVNYEVYRLFWHDLSNLSARGYGEAKGVKADAVKRETQRRLGSSESLENKPEEIEDKDDPADLPYELHAANIAFRAVTNGHGDKSATFKNRLISYLETNFADLNSEAVQRIATVANPDKTPGRKKRSS